MTTILAIALATTRCPTLLASFIRHNPLLWIAAAIAWGMLLRTAFASVRAYLSA